MPPTLALALAVVSIVVDADSLAEQQHEVALVALEDSVAGA
jgi:hypothetical protein